MNSPNPTEPSTGRYAYAGLERIFHERARLSILTSLVAHREGLAFNDLKHYCQLTDGNLSRHLQILQDAELVEIHKGLLDGRPHTLCRLSDQGRERFLDYISCLEHVINDALRQPTPGEDELGQWSTA